LDKPFKHGFFIGDFSSISSLLALIICASQEICLIFMGLWLARNSAEQRQTRAYSLKYDQRSVVASAQALYSEK